MKQDRGTHGTNEGDNQDLCARGTNALNVAEHV